MPKITDPALLGELNGGQQGNTYPGVIRGPQEQPKPVDPYKVERDNRGDFEDARDTVSSLRKEFRGLPTFQAYDVALGAFNSSLKTADNAQGDQSLITSYAKMLDPTSAVREGEFATTASTENTLNQIKARLAKEFGFEEGGMLSPEGREFVRQEMWNLVNERFRPAYERDRTDYEQIASDYGYDTFKVVGSDPIASYQSDIDAFLNPPEDQTGGNQDGFQEGYRDGGLYVRVTDDSPDERVAAEAARQEELRGAPGVFDVAKSGMTLGLIDEASGVGEAIGGLLRGDTNIGSNYALGRDAERLRQEQARENIGPVASIATELAGGGAGILTRGGAVMRAGRAAAGARGGVNRANVQREMTREATRSGAQVGALGGFGYGEGEGSLTNALVGGVAGGALGNVAQRAGNAIANRPSALDPVRARQVAQAGEAEGVTVNRAMIDPRQENTFSGAEATRIGGPRINREMNRIEGQIENRIADLGGGATPEQEAAGTIAQNAVRSRQSKAGAIASRAYDQADSAAGGVTVTPTKALQEIDANIAELESAGANANRGAISYLKDIRSDIENGITIRGLRDQRTNMRGQINERNLGQTDAERRIGRVMDSASEDIDAALVNNPKARRLYQRADKIWRDRAEFRRQIEQDVLGPADNPKSGTQAARKLESWMRDDAPRFRRAWEAMDDAEKSEIRGYIANALGRNAKGEFAPHIFLNNMWDGQSRAISERTARIVFGDEGVQSLKNLKTLSEEVNRLNAMRNSSNTGRVNNYSDWLLNALGFVTGGGAGMMGGSATALAGAAAGTGAAVGARAGKTLLDARMLMNPKISKWIASAPKTANPKAIDAHFARLGGIAKAEPALAGDIELLRGGIMRAANDNLGAVAAEEPTE